MNVLVQELKEMSPDFHKKLFGMYATEVKVDIDELILSGHSFGAMTAVSTAAKLPEQA